MSLTRKGLNPNALPWTAAANNKKFNFVPETQEVKPLRLPPGLQQNWGPVGRNVEQGYFNADNNTPEGYQRIADQILRGDYDAVPQGRGTQGRGAREQRKRTRKQRKNKRKQTRRK